MDPDGFLQRLPIDATSCGDLRFRPAMSNDFAFLRELHRATMRPYVEAIWGWDDAAQLKLFTDRFDPSKTEIVEIGKVDAGALSVEVRDREIFLASIMMMPFFQGRGIGSKIIDAIKSEATRRQVPMTLTVLRPNPAKTLYERLGFKTVKADDIRFYMEFVPPTAR